MAGLDHERVGVRSVVAPAGDQPDAHRVATGHQPEVVVLDLVNPVGAGRGLVGGGREAGFDELGLSGKPLTHTLNQHAANLGSRSQDSNQLSGNAREQLGEWVVSLPRKRSCPACRVSPAPRQTPPSSREAARGGVRELVEKHGSGR